jgi:hypothetical protein
MTPRFTVVARAGCGDLEAGAGCTLLARPAWLLPRRRGAGGELGRGLDRTGSPPALSRSSWTLTSCKRAATPRVTIAAPGGGSALGNGFS